MFGAMMMMMMMMMLPASRGIAKGQSESSGITLEGKVLVWLENRTFEALDTRSGIVLRPLVDGRHRRRRRCR